MKQDYETKSSIQILEENLLDEFFILVRRIPGLSMSIDEFMNTSSFQINYLLHKEYEIIEYEEREKEKIELETQSTSRTGRMVPNKHKNSDEMEFALQSYIADD